jgi:diguanylate cyclase (GGDEF)-like protein
MFFVVGPASAIYDTWVGPRTTTFLIMLMLVVVSYTVTALSHYQTARSWRAKALRDDLTGLLHRQAFIDRANRALEAPVDGGTGAAVIVADIDHFKEVNDIHGHVYGDVVLVGYSRAIRSCLGLGDLAGRFGGEEFVVFLADADIEAAKAVTHDIDTAFIKTADPGRHVPTVSYGVALLADGPTLEEAIHAADQALYRAKRAGRARVEAHVPKAS